MVEALEKVKAELMVLGFISLLLVFGQNYIIKICITEEAADTMLPCKLKATTYDAVTGKDHTNDPRVVPDASNHGEGGGDHEEANNNKPGEGGGDHEEANKNEHLSSLYSMYPPRIHSRFLAEANMKTKCPDGKVSLISINGLHQLHIFIFFLAVFHVTYSAITMALGRAKIRGWKEWEKEAAGQDYEFSNDPTRFRFTHETSFVRQHMNVLNKTPASFYIVIQLLNYPPSESSTRITFLLVRGVGKKKQSNFFRQFFRSVRRADYCALRHSFVNVHLAPGSKFDFQKYIKRSLEDDFKVIVGISPALWASALIFLFLNVNGWHTMLWISIMPVVIILSVGTKLQGIICRMAIDITERHAVIQGIPLVQVSDSYFWFARPTFVLFLIHFTLFQNGFQIIYFLWILYEYGMDSCFNESKQFVFARLCLGVVVQFLCSYVTLPLYALVSQMGSNMKQSIFDDQTSKALKNWRAGVKKKAPNSKHGGPGSPPVGGSPTRSSADGAIALTQRKPTTSTAGADEHGTGLQAGAAQASGNNKEAAGDYEFIKIDD
ncbi:hypothetical protein PR202_ga14297 [Eleusine coracana subsp. coracana]|uniref:MLO-like protein n=1 Tax=Eleusine coracana subsp. coracana TaxID=191504 RepID=A0AAV5CGZ8_ELECO|nr:hypothetical protein PR202_ga14297 [Eleusine coracana subsp. coracana]